MGRLLKRYEIKKLESYINIVRQLGFRLDIANLRVKPDDYPGKIVVCDGERVKGVIMPMPMDILKRNNRLIY